MKNKLESADLDRRGKIRQDKSYETWQDKNLSDIWRCNHLFHSNRCHIGWQLETFALIWRFLSDFYRFYPYYDLQVSQNCFQNLKHSIIPSSFHEFLWYWDFHIGVLVRDGTLKTFYSPSESIEIVFEVVLGVVLRILSDFSNSTSIFFDFWLTFAPM